MEVRTLGGRPVQTLIGTGCTNILWCQQVILSLVNQITVTQKKSFVCIGIWSVTQMQK